MSNQTTKIDKRIAEALDWQARLFFEEALSQEVSDSKGIHLTEKMVFDARNEAHQAITQLIHDVVEEVIGEDIMPEGEPIRADQLGINDFKAKQRTTFKNLMKGES